MKASLFICLILSACYTTSAQQADNNNGNTGNTGHLQGSLADNSEALEFVNIAVFTKTNTRDTAKKLLQGGITDSLGYFSLDQLPLNTPLQLKASYLGYKDLDTTLTLHNTTPLDLGRLRMRSDKALLKEVSIEATKPYMTMDIDKKVYNTSRDVVSIGGTGLDVVRNIPGLNVDVDGNVSMRGLSPQIFIDGKPTILTLEQVPASSIESVEIMSNPSAKYDASGGGAGILNVVLKKNNKTGYNGNLRAGLDSYGGYNAGGSLNYRTNKLNISADINARRGKDYTEGALNRHDRSGNPATDLYQQQSDTGSSHMFFGKLRIDYNLTPKAQLSLSAFGVSHKSDNTSDINIAADSIFNAATTHGYTYESIASSRNFQGRGATLSFKQDFKRPKESWTTDINYFSGTASNNSQYTINNFHDVDYSDPASSRLQQIDGGGKDYNIVIQSDYSRPLKPGFTLETGLRAAIQGRKNTNNNFVYNDATGIYDLVPAAASNYKSQSSVYAAYVSLSGKLGDYSFKGGLRTESSRYSGTLLNSGEQFSNRFPLSLFPSLFVSRKLGADQDLQLSYSRRVNRPNFFQLIPYTDSSNTLNITRGNPNLVPEFTQSLELSYLRKLFSKGSFMGSLYYKYTDNLITGYIITETGAAGTPLFVNTYINAASGYSAGAELTGQLAITRWWDLNANVNIYQSKINLAEGQSASQQNGLTAWFGKLNTNFKMPAGFGLQLTGTYQSKTNLPVSTGNNQPGPPDRQSQNASQGYIKPYYFVDIALKKEFLKGKLVTTLAVSDVFRSRKQQQYTYSDAFTQDYSRLKNPQLVRLNFSYNFGKLEMKRNENKNNDIQVMEQ